MKILLRLLFVIVFTVVKCLFWMIKHSLTLLRDITTWAVAFVFIGLMSAAMRDDGLTLVIEVGPGGLVVRNKESGDSLDTGAVDQGQRYRERPEPLRKSNLVVEYEEEQEDMSTRAKKNPVMRFIDWLLEREDGAIHDPSRLLAVGSISPLEPRNPEPIEYKRQSYVPIAEQFNGNGPVADRPAPIQTVRTEPVVHAQTAPQPRMSYEDASAHLLNIVNQEAQSYATSESDKPMRDTAAAKPADTAERERKVEHVAPTVDEDDLDDFE